MVIDVPERINPFPTNYPCKFHFLAYDNEKGCPERHPLVNQISMITGRIMGLRLVVLYR